VIGPVPAFGAERQHPRATQPNMRTPCGRSGSRAALVNEAP